MAWLDGAPPTGRVYSGPDHLNIVSKSRGGLSSSKLHHISNMASTHPGRETIYNVKREREGEGGLDYAFMSELGCVLVDFMNHTQALRACCR